MSSNNFKQVVHKNFALKHWLLPRRAMELVSSCLKICKFLPAKCKVGNVHAPIFTSAYHTDSRPRRTLPFPYTPKDLLSPKPPHIEPDYENKGPLRALTTQRSYRQLAMNDALADAHQTRFKNRVEVIKSKQTPPPNTPKKAMRRKSPSNIYEAHFRALHMNDNPNNNLYRIIDGRRRFRFYRPTSNYVPRGATTQRAQLVAQSKRKPREGEPLRTHYMKQDNKSCRKVCDLIRRDLIPIDHTIMNRIALKNVKKRKERHSSKQDPFNYDNFNYELLLQQQRFQCSLDALKLKMQLESANEESSVTNPVPTNNELEKRDAPPDSSNPDSTDSTKQTFSIPATFIPTSFLPATLKPVKSSKRQEPEPEPPVIPLPNTIPETPKSRLNRSMFNNLLRKFHGSAFYAST